MKRQTITTQMKTQTRNIEVQINEEERDKLSEKIIQNNDSKYNPNLKNKMEKIKESVNKNQEELKNKHAETNRRITEIKNTLEGIKRSISEVE